MDEFKEARKHYVGIGGTKCPCCNNGLYGKNRKKLNRLARSKVRVQTQKEVSLFEEGELE